MRSRWTTASLSPRWNTRANTVRVVRARTRSRSTQPRSPSSGGALRTPLSRSLPNSLQEPCCPRPRRWAATSSGAQLREYCHHDNARIRSPAINRSSATATPPPRREQNAHDLESAGRKPVPMPDENHTRPRFRMQRQQLPATPVRTSTCCRDDCVEPDSFPLPAPCQTPLLSSVIPTPLMRPGPGASQRRKTAVSGLVRSASVPERPVPDRKQRGLYTCLPIVGCTIRIANP